MIVNMILMSLCLSGILVCLADAYSTPIQHYENGDDHLISTGSENYSLSTAALLAVNYKTASIEGVKVTLVSPTCETTVKNLDDLDETLARLIASERSTIVATSSENRRQPRPSLSSYSYDGRLSTITIGNERHINVHQRNGFSLLECDNDNFSKTIIRSADGLLARMFFNKDLLTYVYHDSRVQMKPTACLDKDEQELLQKHQADCLVALDSHSEFKSKFNKLTN